MAVIAQNSAQIIRHRRDGLLPAAWRKGVRWSSWLAQAILAPQAHGSVTGPPPPRRSRESLGWHCMARLGAKGIDCKTCSWLRPPGVMCQRLHEPRRLSLARQHHAAPSVNGFRPRRAPALAAGAAGPCCFA